MSRIVYVTRGLPASGKSTWAKEFAERTGAIRFNMDDLRNMMGFPPNSDSWTKYKENVAFDLMVQGAVQAVRSGSDVVLDNTHVVNGWLTKYKRAFQYEQVLFNVIDFSHVSAEECLVRNSRRTADFVPEHVVHRMNRSLNRNPYKTADELSDFLNAKPFELRRYSGTPGKPRAIVVDLDGTLFHMSPERSPYQFWLVEKDTVDPHVLAVIRMARAQGYKALLVSGRDGREEYRACTERALAKNSVVHDLLRMRPAGDTRRDDEVKHEIFWAELADEYDVQWCLDDRNQVVDLYRAMGIPCWQVAEGNF